MKKIIACLLVFALTTQWNVLLHAQLKESAPNTLTKNEKKEGWKLLFDGKTTKGWKKFNSNTIGSAWRVGDGCLYLDPTFKDDWQIKNGGDIVTDQAYGDFDLKLEWKIEKNGNSGIILFVVEDTVKYKYPWETGPEMQVLDNVGHPDGKYIKHRAGDLYDLITSSPETVNPYEQWNAVEVKSYKGQLDFWLNGQHILSTELWGDSWKKLIAGSKFKSMPDFGVFHSGKIGLQDHGNKVWFRNIKIKQL
jgi:hypothetical protein